MSIFWYYFGNKGGVMIGHATSQRGIARGKLLIVLAVIGVLVVTGAALFSRPSSEEKRAANNPTGYRATADQFMKSLTQNDAAGTYNIMTAAGKQEVGSIDQWARTVNDSFSKSKAKPEFLSEYSIEDPGGVYGSKQPKLVTYRIEIFSSTWETSLTIIKDGDSWKVDRLSSEPR